MVDRCTLLWLVMLAVGACSPSAEEQPTPQPPDAGAPADTKVQDVAPDAEHVADAGGSDLPAPPELPPPFDWCTPEGPPGAECFASRRDASSEWVELAAWVGDRLITTRKPEKIYWDWGEAVMLLGLVQLYRVTGDERYQDFYRAFMDHHIEKGYEIWSSDSCAPAAIAIALIADGDDNPAYQKVVEDALYYLAEEALRTPEGGLNHLGTLDATGVSLWADSLFMFGNVLTGWGEVTGDVDLLDDYAEQYAIFAELMQDDSGFFKHAVYTLFEQEPDVYWARANGWIAAAAADHLRVRRNRGEALPAMAESVTSLMDAAAPMQDPETGLFWTVINRPGETYLETSAGALFAFGLARGFRYGVYDERVLPTVRAAVEGVVSRIRTSASTGWPVVTGTSGPTSVGTFDYYAGIEQDDDISYGIGAALLALTEASGLPQMDPTEGLIEVELSAGAGYAARKAEYMALCLAKTGPQSGGIYGQACRVKEGLGDLHDAAIDAAIEKMTLRKDTADFAAAGVIRLLYLDDETGALGAKRRKKLEDTVLAFKFWLDEPGSDGMAYWTENHQILFHSAELLAGQRFEDTVFENSEMTGAEHMAHARPRILRWMGLRGRYGFSEWHSNVYFNEDIPALLNLHDFADDPEIRTGAAMVLDLVAMDLANNMYKGLFATTHGRSYPNKYQGGLTDSTREAAYIMLGLGEPTSGDNFSATFMATGTYVAPAPLEALAEAARQSHEHKQRDSFDVAHGPALGIGYEGLDDVVVWAGLMALLAPKVALGATVVLEEYDLWNGFLFGGLPDAVLGLLQLMAGTQAIVDLAEGLLPLSLGIALEAVDTYVYRTPDYQLAGAQDFKPGMWGPQTIIWKATLDADAFTLTTFPGGIVAPGTEELEVEANDPWTGGWYPRATLHRNVGVFQYRRMPVHEDYEEMAGGNYTHAWFPRDGFDEVREEGHWVIGRKGEGYLALWTHQTATWSDDPPQELRTEGEENVWIVELGSAAENGSFDDFVNAIVGAGIVIDDDLVTYGSPSLGEVKVGWTGPMTVAGEPVDLGPYPRWHNALHTQRHGSSRTILTIGGQTLDLDFLHGTRRLLVPGR